FTIIFFGVVSSSCDSRSTSSHEYEEAKDVFARGLAEAKYNFQIKDEDKYIGEFNALCKVSVDSAMIYATNFRSLIQGNFHLEGESLDEVSDRKKEFDSLEKKYKSKGFKSICDLKKQYDDLGSKPDDLYKKWLSDFGLEGGDFEDDIL